MFYMVLGTRLLSADCVLSDGIDHSWVDLGVLELLFRRGALLIRYARSPDESAIFAADRRLGRELRGEAARRLQNCRCELQTSQHKENENQGLKLAAFHRPTLPRAVPSYLGTHRKKTISQNVEARGAQA